MVIQTDLIEMRHIVGDLVHDITGMKQGSLYFLAYDTGTWDLCVVLTPANPRVRESQQSVNCDFVEEVDTAHIAYNPRPQLGHRTSCRCYLQAG